MRDEQVRVLIVEDTASVAMTLRRLLRGFAVVGTARDGQEALRMREELQPHVITMDINLPDVNGLDLTRQILARDDVKIIVVSSLVEPERQGFIFEALRAGAYEVVAKSRLLSRDLQTKAGDKLVRLVRTAAAQPRPGRTRRDPTPVPRTIAAPTASDAIKREVVAIGASTGGPAALRALFGALPADFPLPILVAQHMAHGFMEGLVRWLDNETSINTVLARSGTVAQASVAYLPPSGYDVLVGPDGRLLMRECKRGGPCPCVDELFGSVVKVFGDRALCIVLTGMGNDGTAGALAAKRAGAHVIAQDEETSVIYGMPRSAKLAGAVHQVLPLEEIIAWLIGFGESRRRANGLVKAEHEVRH